MAIDVSRLPEAKARIRDFRRELCAFLQDGRPRQRVYELSLSLFPVSRAASGPARKKTTKRRSLK
jgi:hypothetical protein